MSKPYSLICRLPPHQGTTVIEEFSQVAINYRHVHRRMGGFWTASFFIPVEKVGSTYLQTWFNDRLMFRVDERVGSVVTWQGVVWAMELNLGGYKERRTVEKVFNAIKTVYTDNVGSAGETGWYTNSASINRYLRRELILFLDNVTLAQAQSAAQTQLVKSAEAWAETTSIGSSGAEGLYVELVGDVFTANNRYVTAGDGSSVNASAFIQDIVETDCDILNVGTIQTNATQVRSSFSVPTRAWDAILDITLDGDGSNPYLFTVDIGGFASYRIASNAPKYTWNGGDAGISTTTGKANPWAIRPGVIRNMTRRSRKPIPGTFLADGRDAWVSEVEMSDGSMYPALKPEGFDPEEIIRQREIAIRWLEEQE